MIRHPRTQLLIALTVCVSAINCSNADSRTIARCGDGWLEEFNGYPVLHLKGSPYELGYQHGVLMKERVRSNLGNILRLGAEETLVEVGPVKMKPADAIRTIVKIQEPFVPEKYFHELRGLAEGAGLELDDVQVANFLPELFHCSGFAIANSATADGTLYHGRVLDYAIDWGLQDHAVVIVVEPDEGIPFVNVSYAGFIGSVTGMNTEHVSVGEMGGGGVGLWQGTPMALLVREVLSSARSLDEAIAIFRDTPRTCQYFYVVADGETNQAVGMEASWQTFTIVRPGESHELLPQAVTDCALLSADERYDELCPKSPSRARDVHSRDGVAADGSAGRHEIEPAQRSVRTGLDPVLGRQRIDRPATGCRAAVSRVSTERVALAHARRNRSHDSTRLSDDRTVSPPRRPYRRRGARPSLGRRSIARKLVDVAGCTSMIWELNPDGSLAGR